MLFASLRHRFYSGLFISNVRPDVACACVCGGGNARRSLLAVVSSVVEMSVSMVPSGKERVYNNYKQFD